MKSKTDLRETKYLNNSNRFGSQERKKEVVRRRKALATEVRKLVIIRRTKRNGTINNTHGTVYTNN